MLQTLEEANEALLPYVPLVAELTGKDTTLERIQPLMELLGNPHEQLKILHIAGTSGKTSTAYYIAALLTASGEKTGLTVSPHVDSVTERAQINGKALSEAEFCEELGEFLGLIEKAEQKPSYFELLYAFAIWEFVRQGVTYAVVETGMGGLYDATNVAQQADKVCVITDIGFDHTHILGKTLPEIAKQKAGIIHESNQVFMYQQEPEIMDVIKGHCKAKQAPLHIVNQTREMREHHQAIGAMPDYQLRNWLLAHAVYMYLVERDDLKHLTRQVLRKTQLVQVPARMDVIQLKGKTIVMDGAHNEQKMTTFVRSFQHLYPGVKPAVMIGLKTGKEYESLVPLLAPLASSVYVTTFETTQDLPVKAMEPAPIAEAFAKHGVLAHSIADQKKALQVLLESPENVCIITGSFYLLSQLRTRQLLT